MVFDVSVLFVLMLVFIALGRRVFKFAGMEFSSFVEEVVFSFGLGAGIVALLTLGIGLLGGLKRWIFYILMFGLLGVLILDVKNMVLGAIRWIRARRNTLQPFETVLLVILGLHFLLTFLGALAPQMEWDSLGHHLTVAKAYIENGRIFNMSLTQGWFVAGSNYPSNMEMLFMLGMLLRSDVVANLIAWSVAAFLALSVYSLSRRLFSVRTSLIAMSILYCSSIVSVHATFNTVDLGVALFALLALYAAFKWADSGDYRFLIFSGIYAGFCAGTKYTGLPVVLVLGFLILLLIRFEVSDETIGARRQIPPHPPLAKGGDLGTVAEGGKFRTVSIETPKRTSILERRRFVSGFGYILLFGMIVLAAASPWYIKNYVYTGNPVYPFFVKILGGRNLPPGVAGYGFSTPWKGLDDYKNWYSTLIGYIRFPWDLTMMRLEYARAPSIGPLYLIFIPCLILVRNVDRKIKYLLFYGLFGLTIVFGVAQQTRYMFPFIAPLAVVAAYSMCRVSEGTANCEEFHHRGTENAEETRRNLSFAILSRDNLIKGVSVFILVAAMVFNVFMLLNITSIKVPVIMGIESRQDYLSRALTNHEAVLYINENLPSYARVLSTDPRIYYCDVPCVYDGAVMDYGSFQDDGMKMLEELKRLNISHVLLSRDSPTFGGNPAAANLYRKLIEQGELRGIFGDSNSALYVVM